jgi:predicted metal-dependent peptidase
MEDRMSKSPSKRNNVRKNGGQLRDTIDTAEDAKAREKILQSRVALVLNHGFFGNLAMRLKLENGDSWLTTAATDGRKFYYNTEFINKLTVGEMMFLFCHELLHAAYDHVGRTTRNHNHQLANVAMDYVVNADLIKHGLGTKINPCLYEKKYEGWSWEQVYDDLYQKAEKIDISDLLEQMIDEHLEQKGAGNNDGEGDGKEGKGKGRPTISEEERQAVRDEIKEALLAANAATGGAGNIPGGLKRIIGELTDPQINWRDLLRQQIQSTIKNDYTYAIPARKNFANGFSLPSMKKDEAIDICVAIDTSGSISQKQLKEFVSEVVGIMGSYDDYKIRMWCFDTRTYQHAEYDPTNGHEIHDYEAPGGGGTDFDANWQYMKENNIEPKMFVMFTDGEPYGSWGDENYCDTVFIINNPYNKNINPPFGISAYYESKA